MGIIWAKDSSEHVTAQQFLNLQSQPGHIGDSSSSSGDGVVFRNNFNTQTHFFLFQNLVNFFLTFQKKKSNKFVRCKPQNSELSMKHGRLQTAFQKCGSRSVDGFRRRVRVNIMSRFSSNTTKYFVKENDDISRQGIFHTKTPNSATEKYRCTYTFVYILIHMYILLIAFPRSVGYNNKNAEKRCNTKISDGPICFPRDSKSTSAG